MRSALARPLPGAALALCLVVGLGARLAHAAEHASASPLWDEGEVLSRVERSAIEARLQAANAASDSPVFLLLKKKLLVTLPSLAMPAYAEGIFIERVRAVTTRPDPVLLVVIVGPPLAAEIATGKGNAGIVPEIDARRITGRLAGRRPPRSLQVALLTAVDEIVRSIQDTVERRRPSPGDEVATDEAIGPAVAHAPDVAAPESQVRIANDSGAASQAVGASSTHPAADTPAGSSGTSKSRRLPLAIAATVLIIVALALRRRKQQASDQPPAGPNTPPRRPPSSELPPRDRQRRPRFPPRD